VVPSVRPRLDRASGHVDQPPARSSMYDLALIHAPSVYDFRNRDDVLFAYLSNSDSVHVSPIFEMPPVGVFAIEQHANRSGFNARFFNVASKMLHDPEFDVGLFFQQLPARYVGFDLHWLVHAHGALALAELYKSIHPDSRTVLGGIAATYYHESLIQYPQVDYVIRGYDTLLPIQRLLASGDAAQSLVDVPNLSWKDGNDVRHNPLTHVPRVFSASVDWSQVFTADRRNMTPYNLIIPQAGCEYNCKWCGGSRYFFKKYMGLSSGAARVQKTPEVLEQEVRSVLSSARGRHTLTTIDFWHEYEALFSAAESVFVDNTKVHGLNAPRIATVHYSLHRLPSIEKAQRMGQFVQAVIELSPDSHDIDVAKASGRGKYTMEEMESFIDALLEDVYSFEIYFMIGLPKQTALSVMKTVEYCEHLLLKYQGRNVQPFVCPMLPFLDPGSEIYDSPAEHGYRLFHHSLEAHRAALVELTWRDRLNYETEWMTRQELVDTSYAAVRRLVLAKCARGKLHETVASAIVSRIDATQVLLRQIDEVQALLPSSERTARLAEVRRSVAGYNREQLRSVMSQQRPLDLGFARQQWFDTDEAIDAIMSRRGPTDFGAAPGC
jgi:clorobiocin biosynthesis protein CloN6